MCISLIALWVNMFAQLWISIFSYGNPLWIPIIQLWISMMNSNMDIQISIMDIYLSVMDIYNKRACSYVNSQKDTNLPLSWLVMGSRTAAMANSTRASLRRYWRASRLRYCSRTDIPAWRHKEITPLCKWMTLHILKMTKSSTFLDHGTF